MTVSSTPDTKVPVFNAPSTEVDSYTHETSLERSGITPRSCFDVMDQPEMLEYLYRLRAIVGVPESKEVDKINNDFLIENAKEGTEQKRLTHAQFIDFANGKTIASPRSSFWSKLFGLFRKQGVEEHDDVSEFTRLVLADEWPVKSLPLPPLDKTLSKSERDKYYNFDTLYRQPILRFIDFVGALPASESNHHNWPEGLLKHSLEVAEVALKTAKTQTLPTETWNDIEAARKVRWQYATFVIGLMHDIGKSMTDMSIYCQSDNGTLTTWNPTLSSLHQHINDNRVGKYFVEMNSKAKYVGNGSRYGRHEGVAAMMLNKILTPEAIHFLSSSPDTGFGLVEEINKILSGGKGAAYLKTALAEGENTSVHISFKKVRSGYHHKDRNASIAELVVNQLFELRRDPKMAGHTFILGGDVFIRFPEAIQMAQSAITRRSPTMYHLSNLHPVQVLEELAAARFIKMPGNNILTMSLQLTKGKYKASDNEIVMERIGGSFKVAMLEHPSLMFGRHQPQTHNTGVLRLDNLNAIEFLNEYDVRELVINKTEPPKDEAEKDAVGKELGLSERLNVVDRTVEESDGADGHQRPDFGASDITISVNENNQIKSVERQERVEPNQDQGSSPTIKQTISSDKQTGQRAERRKPSQAKPVNNQSPPQMSEDDLFNLAGVPGVTADEEKGSPEGLVDQVYTPVAAEFGAEAISKANVLRVWATLASINKVKLKKKKIPNSVVKDDKVISLCKQERIEPDSLISGGHISKKNDAFIVITDEFASLIESNITEAAPAAVGAPADHGSQKRETRQQEPIVTQQDAPCKDSTETLNSEENTPPLSSEVSLPEHYTEDSDSEYYDYLAQTGNFDTCSQGGPSTESAAGSDDNQEPVMDNTVAELSLRDRIIEHIDNTTQSMATVRKKLDAGEQVPKIAVNQWLNQFPEQITLQTLHDQGLIVREKDKFVVLDLPFGDNNVQTADRANVTSSEAEPPASSNASLEEEKRRNSVSSELVENEPAKKQPKTSNSIVEAPLGSPVRDLIDALDMMQFKAEYVDSQNKLVSPYAACFKLLANELSTTLVKASPTDKGHLVKKTHFTRAVWSKYKSMEDDLASINNGVKPKRAEIEYLSNALWLLYADSFKDKVITIQR